MFDIGQNDLAGAFYSKTFDQIVASIPNILVEFETGIKVSSYFRPFLSFRFSDSNLSSKGSMHENMLH